VTGTSSAETTPVALSGDALPCADCGQAVALPDPTMAVTVKRVRNGRVTPVPMTKCEACVERDRTAVDLAKRHLRLGVVVNGYQYAGTDATHLLIEARAALDAGGIEPWPVETTASPAAVLTAEIAHLSGATERLRWRDRLNPAPSVVAEPIRLVEPGTANPSRWAHLDEEDRAGWRDGAVRVLAERVALLTPPVALSPPAIQEVGSDHEGVAAAGCLYCGVGSITITALTVARIGDVDAAARSVWAPRQVTPAAIGARRGGIARLRGWLCPACERAAATVGSASSATALESALSTFLGVSGCTLAGDDLWVTGLQGWGALVAEALRRGRPEPSPNETPWSHLAPAELRELARDWRRGGL
jgi:hypothetical protein